MPTTSPGPALGGGVFTSASPDTTERQAHQVRTSKTVSSGISRCWDKGQANGLDQGVSLPFPPLLPVSLLTVLELIGKKPKGREEIL